jgi:hypothetical protein
MKFVKFLLVLILMGISFICGVKFNEMKSKNNGDIFAVENVEVVKKTDEGVIDIPVDINETTIAIDENVVLPEGSELGQEQLNTGEFDPAAIENTDNGESGTAVPESLQSGDEATLNNNNNIVNPTDNSVRTK